MECDVNSISSIQLCHDFNSRTHVECDDTGAVAGAEDVNFNSRTHVECDVCAKSKDLPRINFNSRTHVECDMRGMLSEPSMVISTHALTWSATSQTAIAVISGLFQLTHSRGVRLLLYRSSSKSSHNFNSRTHVECDRIPAFVQRIEQQFQLTHSRGVRRILIQSDALSLLISTHALTWSATWLLYAILSAIYFNSRTHVECDYHC